MKYPLIPVVTLLGLSAQLMAQTQSPPGKLSEVMVSGELLSRSAEESGQSVVILDEKTLSERVELRSVRDVLREIPNITDVTGTGKAPTVRGVDGTGPAENANAFFAGSRPRLNWQIDGRSATYNEVVFGDMGIWDLQSIEVFRGPQSSLVGRNAIAGTVLVRTEDPQAEQHSAVRVEAGNFSQKRMSLMHNQPVSDSVSLRLAADGFGRQSAVHYDNVASVGDPADIDGHTVRGKLLYDPKNAQQTRLLLTVTDVSFSGPNGEIVVRPFKQKRSNYPQQPVHQPHTTSAGIEFSQFISDAVELEMDASVTDFTFKRKTAPDGSRAEVTADEYVVEPRLRYTTDNDSEWVAGTRLYRAEQKEWIQLAGIQHFTDQSDAFSMYTEGSLPLAEQVELTLGLRYEKEDRQREGGDPTRKLVNINADKSYDALLPKLGLSYQLNDSQVVGVLYSRGFNAGGGGITFAFPIVNYEYNEEFVDSFEIYGRQQWLDGAVQTTQNLFYSLYKDMQLPFDLTPENAIDEAFVVRNADGVRVQGLELGLSWQLTPQWHLFSNLALLDTEITDYPNSGIEGHALFTAPPVALQFGSSWQQQRWQVVLSGQITGGYYSSITNNPAGKTDTYGALHASVTYQLTDAIKLYLTARNLLDDDNPIALYPGVAPSGSTLPDEQFDTAVLHQPRTVAIGAQFNF